VAQSARGVPRLGLPCFRIQVNLGFRRWPEAWTEAKIPLGFVERRIEWAVEALRYENGGSNLRCVEVEQAGTFVDSHRGELRRKYREEP
jgi:hypothetical protein